MEKQTFQQSKITEKFFARGSPSETEFFVSEFFGKINLFFLQKCFSKTDKHIFRSQRKKKGVWYVLANRASVSCATEGTLRLVGTREARFPTKRLIFEEEEEEKEEAMRIH